jgi:hypothetical protein
MSERVWDEFLTDRDKAVLLFPKYLTHRLHD